MNQLYRIILTALITTLSFIGYSQVLLINELMSSNRDVVYDMDRETPDWIEIINTGTTSINLSDYYLSESKTNLLKWQLPDYNLNPGKLLMVYASGKDLKSIPMQWKSIIDLGHDWKYLAPTAEPPATWKSYSFAETGWQIGGSGIGFGDNDDKTILPTGKISVFMRKKFTITELSKIKSLWLNMDYDDGFVAYLNGTEICRASMGAQGSVVAWNQPATSHEANIYRNVAVEGFDVSKFIGLLKPTENVLAVQVHNAGIGSDDFTAIPILTIGYAEPVILNAPQSVYFTAPRNELHSNFKLSAAGETVLITHKNGTISDSISYGIIPSGFSYGRNKNNMKQWGYFQIPTPNASNDTKITTEVVKSKIQFSINEMFLTGTKYLSCSGAAEGEEIRYTTNTKDPTETSLLFRGVIEISKNMVVKARAFKSGAVPGKVVSRTYVFDTRPTLPVFAVTTDSMNLWDNQTGIYVLGDTYENKNPYFGANFWEDWEKPAGIEMVGRDGTRLFESNCGIKIFGAWSRARPQKSLAVFFRNEYGDPILEDIQLFKSKPLTSFKSIVLRNAGNDYNLARFRDGFMTDLVKNLDTDIQAFQPGVLYLNGQYWGHINLREKVNEEYLASNHGIDPEKVDILEYNAEVVEGGNENYLEMVDFIGKNDLVSETNYNIVASQIDVSNYIDYMLSMIYFDNRDWPSNNIKYWRPQSENGKWRWIMYDTDFGFGFKTATAYMQNTIQFALEPNGPNWPNPPWSTLLFRKLTENTGFRNSFINRFADVMNTTFVGASVVRRIDSIAAIIQPEIQRHYNRWGTLTPVVWQNAVQTIRTFATGRASYVQAHISQQFTQSGIFEVALSNSPSKAGSIKLNSIEVSGDLWKGKYFENVPVTLTAKAVAGYKFINWEIDGVPVLDKTIVINLKKATAIKAVYEPTPDEGNSVVINEINYCSPTDKDAGDWVEIYNWGRSALNISGWIFKDDDNSHQFVIPENTVLASNAYLVLCRNKTDFNACNPGVANAIGDFGFGLSSTGDVVRLFNEKGALVDSVSFGSTNPWPAEPNGNGPSLELRQYVFDNALAPSWKSSRKSAGTPGAENSITVGNANSIEVNAEQKLHVYPNPFADQTTIRLENFGFEMATIEVYSLDGKLVIADQLVNNEYVWQGKNQNGQQLHPGIYICRVKSGNQLLTAKIVLKN